MTKKRKLAYWALILCAILWGVAPPLVKMALPHTTPFRWLFYRYLFAAPLSLPILIYFTRKLKPNFKTILSIISLELIGTTAVLAALYTGLKLTTSIEASIISTTSPIFIVLGGIIFLKEKQTKKEWIGLSLAFLGTILITLEPIFSKTNHIQQISLLGNGLIILQNILWAAYLIMAKRVYKKIPKLFINSIAFWVGLLSFFLITTFTSSTPLLKDLFEPIVTTSALYMAIFGSIIASTLYLYGNNNIEASEASIFSYLQIVIAVPLSIWWLNESLSPFALISLLIIALGVYLAEKRSKTC